MADPTLVNGQTTDAVTQAGVIALGTAPANGLATEYQMGAHAIGLAMQNATANQRQSMTLSAGTTTQAVAQLFTLAPSQAARATVETLTGHALVSELISLTAALKAKRSSGAVPRQSALHGVPLEDTGPPPPPPPPPPPTPVALAAAGDALASAVEQLARAVRALAETRAGGGCMNDHEALEAIRKAADRLNTLLEELNRQMAAGPGPGLWQRLCDALDELRRATRMLEDRDRPALCPPVPPVPVGATPPGVVIVGSGNTHMTATPRVVGASW